MRDPLGSVWSEIGVGPAFRHLLSNIRMIADDKVCKTAPPRLNDMAGHPHRWILRNLAYGRGERENDRLIGFHRRLVPMIREPGGQFGDRFFVHPIRGSISGAEGFPSLNELMEEILGFPEVHLEMGAAGDIQ